MALSLAALFLVACLLVALAALAVKQEVKELTEWMQALSARRADAYETVTISASACGLAAATANLIERYEQELVTRKGERTQSEVVGKHESEFFKTVSHELRTPLNSILGFSTVLLDEIDGPLTAGQKENLRAVLSSGRYLKSLVDEVLDVAALQTGRIDLKYETIDVRACLDEVATLLAGERGTKRVDIRVEVDPEAKALDADPRRLRQILVNLGSNAVRATESGAVILSAIRERDTVLLTVADTGPGIPEDEHSGVFEAFTRLGSDKPRKDSGTGLGLAIAKQLTELHNGSISFETKSGKGTRFRVRLPLGVKGQ